MFIIFAQFIFHYEIYFVVSIILQDIIIDGVFLRVSSIIVFLQSGKERLQLIDNCSLFNVDIDT